MKKLVITCAVSLAFAMVAYAQGWIEFDTEWLDYGLAVDDPGNYYQGIYGVEVWELNQATVPPGINLPMTDDYGVAAYEALVAAGFHLEQTYVDETVNPAPGDMTLGICVMKDVTPVFSTVVIAIAVWNSAASSWDAMIASRSAATRAGVIAFTNATADPYAFPPPIPPELLGWNALGTDLVMMPVATPVPNLTIARSGNGVVVSWPNTGSHTLQQNSNLATGSWTTSGYAITTANGTNSVTITPPAGNLFFRLKQ